MTKNTQEYSFDLDQALDSIDLTFNGYIPSEKALEFFAIMRVVTGEDFEFPTPLWHYFAVDMMLGQIDTTEHFPYSKEVRDKIRVNKRRISFMASRGLAKALSLDSLVYTPNGPTTIKDVKIGDTIYDRDGNKTEVIGKSEVFNKPVYKVTLGDGRVLKMSEDHDNIVWKRQRGRTVGENRCNTYCPAGMKEVVKTVKEMYEEGWCTNRTVTEKNPRGRENKFYIPSITTALEYSEQNFPFDEYTTGVILGDGHTDKTGHTTITANMEDFWEYEKLIPYEFGTPIAKRLPDGTLTTNVSFCIRQQQKTIKKWIGTELSYTKRIPKELMHGSKRQRLEVLKGLMDTDGTVHSTAVSYCSVSKGLAEDVRDIVRSLGGVAYVTEGVTNSDFGKYYRVQIHINEVIFKLSRKVERQLVHIKKKTVTHMRVPIENIEIIETGPTQCIAVDSPTKSFITDGYTVTHNSSVVTNFFPVYCAIKGSIPDMGQVYFVLALGASAQGGGRVMAKAIQSMCDDSKFCKDYFEHMRFTETEAEFTRRGNGTKDKRTFLVRTMGVGTGSIRGVRSNVGAHRPDIIMFDDCIPNMAAAYSEVQMEALEMAMNADAINALKGGGKGKIFNVFTPFHLQDPNVKSMTSGAYTPIAIPICEEIHDDMTEEEFQGAWADMHPYDAVYDQYQQAKMSHTLGAFMQERMLRVSSDEERMVPDELIQWYDRTLLVRILGGYNLYLTTDFTTTSEAKSDFSALALWAVSSNGDYFLLDLCIRRQTLQEQYNELFRMLNFWKRGGNHIEVGVEIDGQQKAHIFALKEMMQKRNEYFTFAKQKDAPVSREGILSKNSGGGNSKHERFRYMMPLFQNKKFYFPNELRETPDMKEALRELKYTTYTGFAGHDDFNDTISQLGLIDIRVPSEDTEKIPEYNVDLDIWDSPEDHDYGSRSTVF